MWVGLLAWDAVTGQPLDPYFDLDALSDTGKVAAIAAGVWFAITTLGALLSISWSSADTNEELAGEDR